MLTEAVNAVGKCDRVQWTRSWDSYGKTQAKGSAPLIILQLSSTTANNVAWKQHKGVLSTEPEALDGCSIVHPVSRKREKRNETREGENWCEGEGSEGGTDTSVYTGL